MRRLSAMKSVDSSPGAAIVPANTKTNPLIFRLVLIVAMGGLWGSDVLASERTPGAQLTRMSDALRSLSYEGALVYLHDNKLETLRIVHRVKDGQIREQLVSLNGPVRTVTREKGNVICELSDGRPISVPGHGAQRDLLHARSINPDNLAGHYLVHRLGSARVAGRQADVVGIVPRDGLRYGYRFYLDRESGLPLKSDLMGEGSDPIEQIMFTSLQILTPEEHSPAAVEPEDEPQPLARDRTSQQVPSSVPWRFVELPAGFSLVMHDNWRDAAGQPVAHFVLSDGLASVSVYIEHDPKEGLEGGTRIGAVHAAGSRVSGHQVTVVGEVPSVTVEAVLAGIRHNGRERQ